MDIQSEFLIDMVSNAPFLAFLLWQYRVQRADYKEAQEEMRLIREKAKEEEEKIRSRWEGVVSKLDKERNELMTQTKQDLHDTREELKKFRETIKKQSTSLGEILEEVKDSRYASLHLVEVLKNKDGEGKK